MAKAKYALCESCPYVNHVAVKSDFSPSPVSADITFVSDYPTLGDVGAGVILSDDRNSLKKASTEPYKADYVACLCCKPNDNPQDLEQALKCCRPRLEVILSKMSASTIVPLGNIATREVTQILGVLPESDNITKARGKKLIAQATLFREEKTIIPTYSPKHVAIHPELTESLNQDINLALGRFTPKNLVDTLPPVHIIESKPQFYSLMKEFEVIAHDCVVAYDIETEGFKWFARQDEPAHNILCVGFCFEDKAVVIVPWTDKFQELVQYVFDNFPFTVGHNGKFDNLFLQSQGIHATTWFDTMLAQHIFEPDQKVGLKDCGSRYFGMPDWDEALKPYLSKVKENVNYRTIPKPILYKYLSYDVWVTYNLYLLHTQRFAKPENESLRNLFFNLVMPEVRVIEKMQKNGIQVDPVFLDRVGDILSRIADELKGELCELAGSREFNPASSQQVASVIYDKLLLPLPSGYKYKLKPRSTDAEALDKNKDHPFIAKLLEYRTVAKLSTSYVSNIFDRLSETGRAHCDYLVHGTKTGRLSTRDPALQTIPRGKGKAKWGSYIKASFVSRQSHVLVMGDYSQAELRVAAHLSQDQFLLDVYNNDRDLHSEVAAQIWGKDFTPEQRSIAKIVNFGWLYGANDSVIAAQCKIPLHQATKIVADYEKVLHRIKAWRDEQFAYAQKYGYISTPAGRRQSFVIDKKNFREVWKSCSNTPVQGGAAEATIETLIRLDRDGWADNLVLTVHDSILLEVPEEAAQTAALILQNTMTEVGSEMFPTVKWKADITYLPDGRFPTRWTEVPDLSTLMNKKS